MNGKASNVYFFGESLLEKHILAESLRNSLEAEVSGVDSQIKRKSGNRMDVGAILAITLDTASIIAIAKDTGNWTSKNYTASVTLIMAGRAFDVKNVRTSEIQQLINAFMSKNEKSNG
jgi:hypothetical protein